MFRQILVPLDGSELAERALPYAQELAARTGATLHLVRVCDRPPAALWAPLPLSIPQSTYDDLLASEEQEARTYLDAVCHRLRAAALNIESLHLIGDTAPTLLAYERDAGIDLVVMSSHGRGGLTRIVLGSVADSLLHSGSAPLLLVRGAGTPSSLQRIVLPLDGSPPAEAALPVVHSLAGTVIREVTVLRVLSAEAERPEAERYLTDICLGLRRERLVCLPRVALGDPAQAIIEAAGADATVVMATHGRSGLTRWALGSVADRVARQAGTAVMLVRAAARAAEPAVSGPTRAAAGG